MAIQKQFYETINNVKVKVYPITRVSAVQDSQGNSLETLLQQFLKESDKGVANGVAGLDENAKLPISVLPAFDTALSDESENAVQNKILKAILDSKADTSGSYQNLIAGGLLSKDSDSIEDNRVSFIFRSTAGNQSISDGSAKLTEVFGNTVNGQPFTSTEFKSVGYNAFNPLNVLSKTFDASGNISDSSTHKIGWVHCLQGTAGAGNNNGYSIYMHESQYAPIRVGFSTVHPSVATTVQVLTPQTINGTSCYLPPSQGYLFILIEDTEGMCVHLKWSYGVEDEKYEEYKESIVQIPQLHTWGLGKAVNVMDEISFLHQISTKRVDRAVMSNLQWTEIITEVHEDPEDETSPVVQTLYKYETSDLIDQIKEETVNVECYGLSNTLTMSVDAEGKLIVDSGETQILDPTTEFIGLIVYYELKTYVVDPQLLDPKYDVSDFGTEEFVGTSVAPYYATFLYIPDLYDAIRTLIVLQKNQRSYTIDFNDYRQVVQERCMAYPMKIKKIITDNVQTLKVSVAGGSVMTLTLSGVSATTKKWEGTINVALEDLLVWNITRITENSIASINIEYEY